MLFDVVCSTCSCDSVMGNGTSWAALVLALCAFCGQAKGASSFAASRTRQADSSSSSNSSSDYLKVGRSLNLLPRYGFLTLSIKVFPHRTGGNDWLFRERTAEVFRRDSYWRRTTRRGPPPRRGYDRHFLVDFCDDVRELLAAYFESFSIEGVPDAHRVLTSSISTSTKAQHLGVHPTFLSSEYSFVLVRLFRRSRGATLDGRLTLNSQFEGALGDIRVGSSESVNQFLDHYGTHVITEYEVGDVMYQVYVFGASMYSELKNNFAMSKNSQRELTRMERYFTPYYALHVGRVKLASGNREFQEVVGEHLTSMTIFRIYQSIFSIFKNQDLADKLEKLDGEVVLSLKLEKITKIVPKSPERHWLGEILDNTLALYYVTM